MAAKSKKYLITTETKEILFVRQDDCERFRWFCNECDSEVEMLNLDAAVKVSKIRAKEIFQMIQSGEIHSVETTDGYLLLCIKSLVGESK